MNVQSVAPHTAMTTTPPLATPSEKYEMSAALKARHIQFRRWKSTGNLSPVPSGPAGWVCGREPQVEEQQDKTAGPRTNKYWSRQYSLYNNTDDKCVINVV